MNGYRTVASLILVIAGAMCSAFAGVAPGAADDNAGIGAVGAINGSTLYLETGPVDTSALRAGLGDFIARERANTKQGLAGRHFVVQLAGPMRPQWRQRLEAAGIVPGDYVPMNAFITTLDRADAKACNALEFVRWYSEYQPSWKIAPGTGTRPLESAERLELDRAGQALVIVTLFRGAAPDSVVRHLIGLAGAQVHWVQPIGGNQCVSVSLNKADIAGLAGLGDVQFVEDAPEISLRNDTDRWIVQSNVANSTPLYDHGIHGEGQILGILDTRVDRNHCSFSDTQPIGPDHRKILAYNASAGAEFHGTHTACTAVGDHNDNTATRGVAYLGKLVYNTIPNFTETDVEARLNTHHMQGGRLHTNSWGDDGTTQYNSLCRGIDAFSYDNEDDLVCFAVTNTSTLKNPENAKNLLAVGASQDTPSQDMHCSGGQGPTSDQRRKPEIYAPGCNTNSANAGTPCGLAGATGTSMACPAVTGTGMLVRQYYAEGYYPTGAAHPQDAFTPSAALIKATLLNSAVDMTGIPGYPSNREGWGRVLADDALYFPGDARHAVVVDVRNADGLSTDQFVELPLGVLGSDQELKVTLVWTEPPAAAGASFASINNLDLELVAPGDMLYKGNVFSGGQSATGGTADDRNNVEQVHLNAPSPGQYTIRIRGAAVNQGTQGYAVVVTGDIFSPALGVAIHLTTPLPSAIPADEPFPLQVSIDPGADTLVAGSALLHYRFDNGAFLDVPLMSNGGLLYSASIPAPTCTDHPQFYVSAEGVESGLTTDPRDGAAAPYEVAVGTASQVLSDDMESDHGWTVGAPDDTATAGIWVRVAPNPGTGAPSADHSDPGTVCFVTGQESPLGGASRNDVDDGSTSLISPRLDLSTESSAVLSYWRWFSNSEGPAPMEDTFLVQASENDGATWVTIEQVGPTGDEVGGGWFFHQAALESFVSLTSQVRVRFVAQDAGTDSLIEAGVDDVLVDAVSCTDIPRCPCDWNGGNGLNSQDFFDFVTAFFSGEADFNADGTTNSQDFFDFVACFFAGCP